MGLAWNWSAWTGWAEGSVSLLNDPIILMFEGTIFLNVN